MTYPCPFCRAQADLVNGCPGCGRGPDRDAAEVIHLDAEISALNTRLRDLWARRNAAAARVRASRAVPGAAWPSPAAPDPAMGPPAAPGPAVAAPHASRGREASTKLVQTALFLLGGLLLGVAAVVFTAVAWSQFGVQGRAALLAAFTAAALGAPLLALRRDLTATAETFAAVGLLLVLLDGYAAWYVDLFGVAGYSAYGYAGAVCALTAAVAAGYEHLTGLTGPRYAALIVAQPVLPLVVAPLHPDAAGWAYVLAAVAALNLAVIHVRRGTLTGVGITAGVFAPLSVVGSGCSALASLAVASSAVPAATAGTSLITAALVVVAGAVLARIAVIKAVAGGLLVVAVGVAIGRFVVVTGHGYAPVLIAAVVCGIAFVVATLPAAIRRGPWAGALVVLAVPALVTLGGSAAAAVRTLDAAYPVGSLTTRVQPMDWQLPVSVVLLTAGLAVLVPRPMRRTVGLGGAALLALAAPAGFGLPWWSGPAFDLLVAGAALAVATRIPDPAPAAVGSAAAVSRPLVGPGFGRLVSLSWPCALTAALVGHALLAGFGRPGVAAATLGGVVVLGLGAAAAAWSTPRRSDVGGASLAVGLLAVPTLAWTVADLLSSSSVWQARGALGAAALVVGALHVIARRWPPYRGFARAAALLGLLTAPLWPLSSSDSPAIFAGAALLLVATTIAVGRRGVREVALLLGVGFAFAVAGSLRSVLAGPYAWLGSIWSGRPDGVGVDPEALGTVQASDVAALVLLAAAAGLAAYLRGGRPARAEYDQSASAVAEPPDGGRSATSSAYEAGGRRPTIRSAGWAAAPGLALAVPTALAVAGVPWPGVPAASLIIGLAILIAVALWPPFASGTGRLGAAGAGNILAVVSAVLTGAFLGGAGLAGALPSHGSTLAALGTVLIVGAAAGTAGRALAARLAGWVAAAVAALLFAFTAGRTLGLALPPTALAVLAAAAVTLALGSTLTVLGTREAVRPAAVRLVVEGRAVQAAAHAGALVALLLASGSARYAAAVCTLWGVALGVRALLPGERRAVRHVLVVAAAAAEVCGWWLLIAAERVSTLEAYTLPAAGVALLAGSLVVRSAPSLTSWVGYGPALAAALLPTLASVLVGEGQPVRRLILGVGALIVVIFGTQVRLQAPVVIGGGVLTVVALHEVVLVWDLLPRWIPLAAAGLLLVGLAMTLERRRRDLARVRAAITRMS